MNLSTAIASDKQLSAEEQEELRSNTKLQLLNEKGAYVWIYYDANGTMKGKHEDGFSDEGKWHMKGALFCRKWDKWANRELMCYTTFDLGDGWYKSVRESDGKIFKYEIVGD